MTEFIRHFLLAVQFFTRIPITGRLANWVGYSPEMLRHSVVHFPGIGWMVGGVAAGVFVAVSMGLPDSAFTPMVAAILSTMATVMLTGAFHEDGLADAADGLGGSLDRERALDIMKDSRLGTYGVLALVLGVAFKVALLSLLGSISLEITCVALLLGHTVSRSLPLFLIFSMPHVGDTATSKSKPLADQISPGRLVAAMSWSFVLLALSLSYFPDMDLIAPLLSALLAYGWMWRLFSRRLQGFTGDCLGATQQVCEAAFYFGVALSLTTISS